jgi:hypothetical protein
MFTRNFHRAGRAIGHGEAGRLILSCVAVAALVLAACEHSGGGAINPDLNRQLIGRFLLESDASLDYTFKNEVICNGTTVVYNMVYNGETYISWAGTIEHVYNFNAASTAGCLIVKYSTYEGAPYAGKYGAMYFSHVNSSSVKWGDAYDAANQEVPTAATKSEAIEKFKPENANRYGGADAQQGEPLIRQ